MRARTHVSIFIIWFGMMINWFSGFYSLLPIISLPKGIFIKKMANDVGTLVLIEIEDSVI